MQKGIKKNETGLIPLEPVSSNNLLKYSLNKSELTYYKSNTMPKTGILWLAIAIKTYYEK